MSVKCERHLSALGNCLPEIRSFARTLRPNAALAPGKSRPLLTVAVLVSSVMEQRLVFHPTSSQNLSTALSSVSITGMTVGACRAPAGSGTGSYPVSASLCRHVWNCTRRSGAAREKVLNLHPMIMAANGWILPFGATLSIRQERTSLCKRCSTRMGCCDAMRQASRICWSPVTMAPPSPPETSLVLPKE